MIFADPPYAYDDASLSDDLGSAVRSGWGARDALVIVERAKARGAHRGDVLAGTAQRHRTTMRLRFRPRLRSSIIGSTETARFGTVA